jgi:hypothetical protein
VNKSRIIISEGHLALRGQERKHTGFWWGKSDVGGYLEGLGVDGHIILKWMLVKQNTESLALIKEAIKIRFHILCRFP